MADDSDVQTVADMLPGDSAEQGWDVTRIGTDLDAGLSPNKIALAYYRKRAADTATYVDISESGSSRSLSSVHRNMLAMADLYQKLVNLEDTDDNVDDPPATRGPGVRLHSIRRGINS
jgi:hypothetical protein